MRKLSPTPVCHNRMAKPGIINERFHETPTVSEELFPAIGFAHDGRVIGRGAAPRGRAFRNAGPPMCLRFPDQRVGVAVLPGVLTSNVISYAGTVLLKN